MVTYSITGGNGAGLFEIDPITGEVSLASGQSLDAETATSHVLTITASDGTAPVDTSTVTITVTDVDEFDVSAPVDNNAAANAVNENAANGATVGVTAFASDADGTTNGVTYAITGGTGLGLFAIDADDGRGDGQWRRSTARRAVASLTVEVTATSQTTARPRPRPSPSISTTSTSSIWFGAADYPATVAEDISDTTPLPRLRQRMPMRPGA